MGAPDAPTEAIAPGLLPEPTTEEMACEVCGSVIHYLRVTTPPGMPDFIHSLDDYAWIGWSWLEQSQELSLVATCSRACLGEWWLEQTAAGA